MSCVGLLAQAWLAVICTACKLNFSVLRLLFKLWNKYVFGDVPGQRQLFLSCTSRKLVWYGILLFGAPAFHLIILLFFGALCIVSFRLMRICNVEVVLWCLCVLCYATDETSSHLFLTYDFAKHLWCWLETRLHFSIDLANIAAVLDCILAVCNS